MEYYYNWINIKTPENVKEPEITFAIINVTHPWEI